MHRSTPSPDAASFFPVDLGQHRLKIAPFGEVMRVAAMRAVHAIIQSQGLANSNRRCFLSDRKVNRTAHLLLAITRDNTLLHRSDVEHLAIKIAQ